MAYQALIAEATVDQMCVYLNADRLRPWPLPRRPKRLDQTPDGLTRRCTRYGSTASNFALNDTTTSSPMAIHHTVGHSTLNTVLIY